MSNVELRRLVENIKSVVEDIYVDIDKVDNKAAKRRVRTKSVKLEKLFKEYRKISLK